VVFADDVTQRQFTEFNNTAARSIANLCGKNTIRYVRSTDSLLTLIDALSTRDIHRVYVLRESRVINIIPQSRLLTYLQEIRSRKFRGVQIPQFDSPVVNWSSLSLEVRSIRDSDMFIREFGM
jgi:hypothetical protein